MPVSGLLISQIQTVTVVNFGNSAILDGIAVESIRNELYTLVDQQARRKIVLDFEKVKFLSSMMLGVLIDLHKRSQAINGTVIVCGLRKDLFKVFKVMNLHKLLDFAKTQEEALGKFDTFTQP